VEDSPGVPRVSVMTCPLDTNLHPPVTDEAWPAPELIKGEEEYEVEDILDHRGGKRRRQYLVKWKGYPLSDATWEPKSSLCHAPDVILRYEHRLEG
jgi:hypothetical protein